MAKRYVRIGWRRHCRASIEAFLDQHPRGAYRDNLRRYLSFWRRRLFRRSLGRDDLPWIVRDALADPFISRRTKEAKLSALRTFLKYLVSVGILAPGQNRCSGLREGWFFK